PGVQRISSFRNVSVLTVGAALGPGFFSRHCLPQTLRRLEAVFLAEVAGLAVPLRVRGHALEHLRVHPGTDGDADERWNLRDALDRHLHPDWPPLLEEVLVDVDDLHRARKSVV